MKLSTRKNTRKCSFSLKAVLMLVLLMSVLSVAASAATVYTDGNFKYTLSDSKATVTGYVEEINGVLSIPETLGGYPVTAVGENAFTECMGITHLVLPDTCTLIGKKAFLRCESLESIDLPEGLKTVGYQSFHSCTSLKSVTIPDSVTRFAYSPFGNCTALEEIVFSPDSLLEIVGEDAFFNCTSLKSFTLPKNVNTEYEGMFRSCTSLESVTINAELPSIPMYMFEGCKNLKSVTFEEGSKVTAVCKRAFSGCELLSSITLPESIETIDTLAFEKCNMLSDVKIKSLSAYICEDAFTDTAVYNDVGDWTDGVLYIDGYLIKADTELSGDYVIPDGTKEIAEAAFLNCKKLTSVTIPDGITVIPKRAFENCTRMKNAELPDGIKVIDDQAFYQCTSLERFRLPLSLESVNHWAFGFCVNLLTLEHYGKEIYVENYSGNFGAPNYYAYKFINLADGTTSYRYTPDKNGFVFKGSGDSIQLVAYVGDEDTVTLPEDYNGKPYTIFYLRGVKNVIIPETITEIPQHAFEECTTLESVTLHSKVYTIRDWSFYGCFNLKKIVLSEHLSTIMNNAFTSCFSLDNVVIPAGVHTIGSYAFSNCSRLKSFSFAPNIRLTEINANVFSGCKSLEKIKLPDTIEKISAYAFDGTLYYNNEENWEDGVLYLDEYLISGKKCEGEELVIKDGTRVIALNAFSNADQLEKVTLPASLEIIGDDAFTSCVQLYEVYNNSKLFIVPGSSEYGGVAAAAYIVYDGFGNPLLKESCYMTPDDFVFEYLDGVYYLRLYLGDEQSITLPSSYYGNSYVIKNMKGNATEITVPSVFDTISEYAFSPNKTLKKINLPSTVTKIDNYAFAFCSSLEEINLPDSITYIGESAFRCCALKNLDLPSGIKSINDWAFYSCIYIEEVVIPSGVTEIGRSAFYDCFDLKRVTVPATVQSIDAYAFYFCESLESLTFEKGSAISSIGMCAFPDQVDIYLYCYSNSFMSDFAESSNCDLYYVDLDAFYVDFDGISLVLDGTIGMKFYFKVPEVIVPYITFSAAQRFDSSHTLISYNEFTTENGINKEQTQLIGARVYTVCSAVVPIAPKDALESYLTVKVSCGDKYDIISSIRVSDYISSFRNMAESSSEYSEALELVDAMETYIDYAAAYFTDEEYTDTVELVDNGLDTVPAPTKSGSAKGITHLSTSLLLEGETTLRHYFEIDGATVTRFKLGNLYLTPVHLGENIYCVDIPNISADELDTVYTVSVNGTLELSCSVLNYVKAAIDSSDTRLAELAKSLYNYHCSAKKYAE